MIDFVPSLHYQEKMQRQFQQQFQADIDIAFKNGCEAGRTEVLNCIRQLLSESKISGCSPEEIVLQMEKMLNHE